MVRTDSFLSSQTDQSVLTAVAPPNVFKVRLTALESGYSKLAKLCTLRDEWIALNRLGAHPGIVRVHWYEDHGDFELLALEHIHGDDIERYLVGVERNRTVLGRLCMQLGDIESFLLTMGIEHRDITAQNFLVEESGRVRLFDFDLAVAFDPRRMPEASTSFMGLEGLTRRRTFADLKTQLRLGTREAEFSAALAGILSKHNIPVGARNRPAHLMDLMPLWKEWHSVCGAVRFVESNKPLFVRGSLCAPVAILFAIHGFLDIRIPFEHINELTVLQEETGVENVTCEREPRDDEGTGGTLVVLDFPWDAESTVPRVDRWVLPIDNSLVESKSMDDSFIRHAMVEGTFGASKNFVVLKHGL